MSQEKAVVVGAGGIAGAWLGPLRKEGVKVSAVVDLNVENARKRISEFELDSQATDDLPQALAEHKPDFVIDLTVPQAHCKVTCTALEAGFPVIGEKPMANSMAEARKMVATSLRTGKLYMVSQSRRWDANHLTVRQSLQSGEIGRLTTINCDFFLGAHFGGFRDEMASPLILDMAIHHFDLARYMAGVDPASVFCREFNPAGSWYKGDVAASCIFEMTGGVIFSYRGSWCAEGCHTSWNGDWRFIGDKGTILYEHDKTPYGQVLNGDTGFNRPLRDAAIQKAEMPFHTMHGALREMLEFVRTGKRPQTECTDNIKSLAMVFAAIESSRTGRTVPVEAMKKVKQTRLRAGRSKSKPERKRK